MIKLPKSCKVVVPTKASKTVSVKCSSTKTAAELRNKFNKGGRTAREETQSHKQEKGKTPYILASCVSKVAEKSAKDAHRRSVESQDISGGYARCTATLKKAGLLEGRKLTDKGKKRDKEKRKAAGAEAVHETFTRFEKMLAKARGDD